MILFDSHAVSEHKYSSTLHVLGVTILTVCALLLHIQCWLGLTAFCSINKVQNAAHDLRTYELMEAVYGIFVVVFMALFVLQAPFAIQFEYSVMTCFVILSVTNLLTQFRILEIHSQSTSVDDQGIKNTTFDDLRSDAVSVNNWGVEGMGFKDMRFEGIGVKGIGFEGIGFEGIGVEGIGFEGIDMSSATHGDFDNYAVDYEVPREFYILAAGLTILSSTILYLSML